MANFKFLVFFIFYISMASCNTSHTDIKDIHIDLQHNNYLQIRISVSTSKKADVWVKYWADSSKNQIYQSSKSIDNKMHHCVLLNLLPSTKYAFKVFTQNGDKIDSTKSYYFTTNKLPIWLQNQFAAIYDSLSLIPTAFKDGFMLLNKRESPGYIYLVDYKGRIRWYHSIDGEGFKVTQYTKQKSIVSILGKNDEQTSYGSEILDIDLYGDTICYLKRNTGDLKFSIHHEILKNEANQYITLFVDKRIYDLQKIGGLAKDTVSGDGIVVLDKNGKKVWQWSVFDVINPLSDPRLLKNKKDWMHANSFNYDLDSNILISFYNNGQIWKIDKKTSKVLWKFGKGGNIKMPPNCNFSMAHAVHSNPDGTIMFFNNGVEKRLSEAYNIKIDTASKNAQLKLHIQLPPEIYNDRMGSAYMVSDSTVLCCSSKRKMIVLMNLKGVLLWDLETGVPSYRAEFLAKEKLFPYLTPIQ